MTRAAWSTCVVLVVAACDQPGVPPDDPLDAALDAEVRGQLTQWGVVPIGALPPANPALVELGRALAFDKILSGNRDISCATCHPPSAHGTDGLSLSVGTGGTGVGPARALGAGRRFIPRNAPSLLNQGLRSPYIFWDGRVSGVGAGPFQKPANVTLPAGLPNILAAQAMLPVLNRQEMRGEAGDLDVFGNPNELAQLADSQYAKVWQGIMQRVLAIPEYVTMFAAAFPAKSPQSLGFQDAATAIAAFMTNAFARSDSPLDRYLARNDFALSAEAKRGALVFFQRARCASCHSGPLLGGQGFANDGVPQLGPGTGNGAPLDRGRGEVDTLPSNQAWVRFQFRVPPLRNVELTAPYMHDGAYPTLEAVVRHYDDVPAAQRSYDVTQLSPALQGMVHNDDVTIAAVSATLDFRVRTPFRFTDQEKADLVAFLKALTDPAARDLSALVPAAVPSGLPVQD